MFRKYLPIAIIAILFYCYLIFGLNYHKSFDDIVFLSVDAKSYEKVGNWLFGNIDSTPYTEKRPFVYPLVQAVSQGIGGNIGIWFVQVIMWLGAILLLFDTLLQFSKSKVVAYIGTLLLILNVSSIIITLHGLSETLTLLLVCTYSHILFNKHKYSIPKYWGILLLLSSLLTCTRPVFQFLILFTLIYSLVDTLINNKKAIKRYALFALLGLSPVLIQLSIVKINHGNFKISNIGDETIRYYYYSKLKSDIEGISIADAKKVAATQSKSDIIRYILEHPSESFTTYKNILTSNLTAASTISLYPKKIKTLVKFSVSMNEFAYHLHLIMFFLLILIMFLFIRKRSFEKIVFLAIPMYFNLLTSGLTFWQGDRIILPSQPLWIILYVYAIILLINKGKQSFVKD